MIHANAAFFEACLNLSLTELYPSEELVVRSLQDAPEPPLRD